MSAALAPTQGPDAARQAASAILSERRFHQPSLPRPLHGPLQAIGGVIESAANAVANAVNSLGKLIPGGSLVVWILLGALLVAVTLRLASNRSRRLLLADSDQEGGLPWRSERPEKLERAADEAEREGRLDAAVRLRFRAGVLRLANVGVIRTASSTPNADIARALHSTQFDALAARFDEIAYGGSPAKEQDLERAREAWPRVLGDVTRR